MIEEGEGYENSRSYLQHSYWLPLLAACPKATTVCLQARLWTVHALPWVPMIE
jgi:hypothetical protein